MSVFAYKGFDSAGKTVSGVVDADSQRTARAMLRREGVFATEFQEEIAQERPLLKREFTFRGLLTRIKVQDVAIVTRQLATLLGAGLPLVEALTATIEQADILPMKRILSQVRDRVNEGSTLADALAQHTKAFSELYVNMVRAGEASGALEVVLQRLADFMENQVSIRATFWAHMIYPLVMIVIAFAVVFLLMVKVIPKLTQIFQDIHRTLPLPTKLLIASSNFASTYWPLILIIIVGLIIGMRQFRRTARGREWMDRVSLRLPLFGKLIRISAMSRFSRTLSTLLASGVPIVKALDIVSAIVGNVVLSRAIDAAKERITEGMSIAEPLRQSKVFPPMVIRMIAVGEQSGELEGMLERVAVAFDREVDAKLKVFTSLLQPVVILIMAGMVGFIIVSILLPILEINQMVK